MKRICYITFLVASLMVMYTASAFAYLDPGTTTYLIQIIAGGVIAAGAAIGIYWYKFKSKFKKKGAKGDFAATAGSSNAGTFKEHSPYSSNTLTAADILGESVETDESLDSDAKIAEDISGKEDI